MKRKRQLNKIACKSMFRGNKGNQLFLLSIIILVLVPSFLFMTLQSIIESVEESRTAVYGNFTDILYDSPDINPSDMTFTDLDLQKSLQDFNFEEYGTLYTVFTDTLSNTKNIQLGYADEKAIELSSLKILSGHLPKADNEVALTTNVATLLGNKEIGGTVEIAGHTYSVVGIAEDYGHMWTKGQKQIDNNITPVNAFITQNEAEKVRKETGYLLRQVLITRVIGVSNPVESTEDFHHNANTLLEKPELFKIPVAFSIFIFIASIVVLLLVLSLNTKRLKTRLHTYSVLGLNPSETTYISRFELIVLNIVGLPLGALLGTLLSKTVLMALFPYLQEKVPLSTHLNELLLLLLVQFTSNMAIIFFYTGFLSHKSSGKNKKQKHTAEYKKISFLSFELNKEKKSLVALTCLVVFLFSLLSYVTFYKDMFSSNIVEVQNERMALDYDFKFNATIPYSPQLDGEPAFFWTNSYEKQGVDLDFIKELEQSPVVEQVKAYRENVQMNLLLKENQIDDYMELLDGVKDNQFEMQAFEPSNKTRTFDIFNYQNDDVLIPTEIIGYPKEDLIDLEKYVVEGKINYDKLLSGEEIVLRVPAFKYEQLEEANALLLADYKEQGTYNSSFKVGDEITLSGLLTDEIIDGGVLTEKELEKFQRKDVKVRIGAIIRSVGGELSDASTLSFTSVITVHEAFEKIKLPATYSHVHVYTKHDVSDAEAEEELAKFASKASHMKFENWLADIKTNKVLNLVITVFLIVVSLVALAISLFILASQLYAKTKSSMRHYFLFRLSGLPFSKLIGSLFIQIAIATLIGSAIGFIFHISLVSILAQESIRASLVYFGTNHALFVCVSTLVIALLSSIPSLIILLRSKKDLFLDNKE